MQNFSVLGRSYWPLPIEIWVPEQAAWTLTDLDKKTSHEFGLCVG